MTFGNKLFELRKSKSLSQDNLAEKLGVSRQAISKWELDETLPDTANLMKIADMFYVSVEYLLNDSMDCEQPVKKVLPVYGNKYDVVNLLAALASVAVSVIAVLHYIYRMIRNYSFYSGLPQRDGHICVYGDRRYYHILDETVILFFLAIVIIVSAVIALKLYKKCKTQSNN